MKIIAFYLPQYHSIPENDLWWGNGFTEWTNVKKSIPLFRGHNQPRVPLNENYYDLLNSDVMKWQTETAKKYGVFGFCFYHYWFAHGEMLLEKPIEQFLDRNDIDFPFCICWANENWSRRWDGAENEILMEQNYGGKHEWVNHFNYLLPFLKNNRYIRINGKPIFVIYKPELIPQLNEMIDVWQQLANENGVGPISFSYQYADYHFISNKDDSKFDYGIEFEPFYSNRLRETEISNAKRAYNIIRLIFSDYSLFVIKIKSYINSSLNKYFCKLIKFRFIVINRKSYSEIAEVSVNHKPKGEKNVACVFTDWDNSPRRGKKASMFYGSTPEKFEKYLIKQIDRTKNEYNKNFLFVNAWNEWGEGAYLEPDEKWKYKYLEAVKSALEKNGYK